MIFGAHVLLYSSDADADRAFLRDVLGFKAVDAGGGWLIFSLPPAEVAVGSLAWSPRPMAIESRQCWIVMACVRAATR